ncbi:MAG: biotin--[acetyl-CoA-carboxylase] ligase [Gammaproteobacteria bacterium]
MVDTHELVGVLADGKFHSGERLASRFGVSRAAVWKRLRRLSQDTGLRVDAVRGRGYRLAESLELLDARRLAARLVDRHANVCERFWVLPSVDSTSAFLARQPAPRPGRAHVCLAEHQREGRGRRGRRWTSGYGTNILMSTAWHFDRPLAALSALSLAVGVAVAEALTGLGLRNHGLKWPNDILVDGRKLAGILVEASGEIAGPARAVVGIGLNMRVTTEVAAHIDQPWVDLADLGAAGLSRNTVAEALVSAVLEACGEFDAVGVEGFLARWRAYDCLLGREVRLLLGAGREVLGRYDGLDPSGGLRLAGESGVRTYHAGEVSLRGSFAAS